MAINLPIVSKFDDKGIKQAKGAFQGLGKQLLGLGAAFGGFAAVSGLVNFGKESVAASSNLQESLNALQVAYGDAGNEIAKLGEDAASRLGATQSAFNAAAVRFSAFAERIVGAGGDVTGFIDTITTRATDFASVFNIDVAEALQVFQSGLAGEAEPLKRFGINLLDSEVKAYGLANGIGEAGRQMTETEKVQARYGLLLESTAKTAGDFANTSDGLANQQRILKASFEEVQAAVGQALLPGLESLQQAVIELLPQFQDALIPLAQRLGEVILQEVVPAFQQFVDYIGSEEGRAAIEDFVVSVGNSLESIGEFISYVAENWQTISNLAIGLGGAAIAFGIYTVAAGIATTATATLTGVALLNPFIALASAIIGGSIALTIFADKMKGERDNASGYAGRLGEIHGEMDRLKGLLDASVITYAMYQEETRGLVVELGILEGQSGATVGELNRFNNLQFGTLRGRLRGVTEEIQLMYHSGAAASAVFEGILDKSGKPVDFTMPALPAIITNLNTVNTSVGTINESLEETEATLDAVSESTQAAEQNMINWAQNGVQVMAQAYAAFEAATAEVEAHNAAIIAARENVAGLFSAYTGTFAAASGMSQMEQAAVNLAAGLREVIAATDASILSRKNSKRLTDYVNATEAEMRRIAVLQSHIGDEIKKVEQTRNDMGSLFDSVYKSIIGEGNITRFTGSAKNIVKQLERQVEAAKTFQDNIRQLREAGLDTSAIEQIQSAGLQAGGATAQALLRGGAEAIGQVNALLGELDAVAAEAGNEAVSTMYGVGISTVDALLEGLYDDEEALADAAERLGSDFARNFQAAFEQGTPLLTTPSLASFVDYFNQVLENVKFINENWEDVSEPAPGGGRQFGESPENLMRIGLPVPVFPTPTGGGGNITININAGIGTNGAELGRLVVDAISRYENTSGKVFSRV